MSKVRVSAGCASLVGQILIAACPQEKGMEAARSKKDSPVGPREEEAQCCITFRLYVFWLRRSGTDQSEAGNVQDHGRDGPSSIPLHLRDGGHA